jgi:hypothetical protein
MSPSKHFVGFFRDYCVEYGAVYTGGDESRVINNLNNADECRARCLQEHDCKYYSFRSGRRNRKKCSLHSAQGFEVMSGTQAISGTPFNDPNALL